MNNQTPDPIAEALANWRPPTDPSVNFPIEEMLGGLKLDTWFTDFIREKSAKAPAAYDQLVVAGMIGRLAVGFLTDPKGYLDRRLLNGESGIGARVAKWAKENLTTEALEYLENMSVIGIDYIFEELEDLKNLAPEQAPERLRSLRQHRDDLESIAFILMNADPGSRIHEQLDYLDDHVATHASLLDSIDDLEVKKDRILIAVACTCPEAWYGTPP